MKFLVSIFLTTGLLVQSALSEQLRGATPEKRKLDISCTEYNLDFEEFATSQYITAAELEPYGVRIEVESTSSMCDTFAPVVFDTQKPTCGDSDLLGSPDDGKAIIIHEKSSKCMPDDCAGGGSLNFYWDEPVNLGSTALRIMDVDERVEIKVQFAGNPDYTSLQDPPRPGNGMHVDYPINESNVIAMKVIFHGSGAIPYVNWSTCPRNPTVWGDPHFKTWSGTKFDYHGACDLKLLESKQFGNGKGLEIQVRTSQIDWYSYISEVAIRIGDNVLEIATRNTHYLNGQKVKALTDLSGYPIHQYYNKKRKTHAREWVYDIELNGPSERIHIRAFKDFIFFSLSPGVYSELEDSTGLMGDWVYGDMLSRDGTPMTDPEEYSKEWQVRDFEQLLFREARFPQFPQHCTPAEPISNSRRLAMSKISLEQAEAACAHWRNDKEQCVYDVMATGDLDIAG